MTLVDIALKIDGEICNLNLKPTSAIYATEFAYRLIAELDSQGWKIVPKEPDEKMTWTLARYLDVNTSDKENMHLMKIACYGVIAAAPKITEGLK